MSLDWNTGSVLSQDGDDLREDTLLRCRCGDCGSMESPGRKVTSDQVLFYTGRLTATLRDGYVSLSKGPEALDGKVRKGAKWGTFLPRSPRCQTPPLP